MQTLTAFENYLLSTDIRFATDHVIQCLVSGPQGNQAWEFMEQFNGADWKCEPEKLQKLVRDSIHSLGLKAITIGAAKCTTK
jgi:hypothetical protein